MGVTQIIFTIVIAIYGIVIITSLLSQGRKKGSLLYKFYFFGLVGLVLLGIPLANGVIMAYHIAIGFGAGFLFLVTYICFFGRSEVIGQRVSLSDAVFLMINKRRREAIALAKNEQWHEGRAIFEEFLLALPDKKKHKRMVCMHDITTCCANTGDFLTVESFIDTASKKHSNNAPFILQLYHNLFLACKKSTEINKPLFESYVQQLEQFVNSNAKNLSKFRFTPDNGTALKGIDAANALVAWAKLDNAQEGEQ